MVGLIVALIATQVIWAFVLIFVTSLVQNKPIGRTLFKKKEQLDDDYIGLDEAPPGDIADMFKKTKKELEKKAPRKIQIIPDPEDESEVE